MADFVPKPYKTIPFTVRVSEKKMLLIDELSENSNLSRNAFVNQCIDYAIENMPKPEKNNE